MADINSVLITGASRGIGLEFVKQFLTSSLVRTQTVIATCRSPEEATDLQILKKKYTNLHILKLDVTQFDTFSSLVNDVRAIVGNNGLTLLINNAGSCNYARSKLDTLEVDRYIALFLTNTVGPVMLVKALRPLLNQSAQVNAKHDKRLGVTRAAVINISSLIGSIQLTASDEVMEMRAYGYRESKAALNMATQTLSSELRSDGILVESIHPGYVITDMTAKSQATTTTQTSVTGMLKVMLSMKETNKKGFWSFDSEILPF